MARVNRLGFLAIAVIFHLVYIYSIFDIYFVSPVVSGMREFAVQRPAGAEAPAKRLVLYVGKFPKANIAFEHELRCSAMQVMVYEQTRPSSPSPSHIQRAQRI